jgi:hypothetical protein
MLATPLGRSLDAVVQGCMAKRPTDRFHSAGELAAIFWALERGDEISVSLAAQRFAPRRLGRRLAIAGVALAGLLVGLGVVVARRHAPRTAASPAAVAPQAEAAAARPFVVVQFDSQPPGAEVRRVPDGELLGVTPFRRAFPRGGARDEIQVEVSREGWNPVRLPVSTAKSRALSVTLAPHVEKPARRRSGPRAQRAVESDKTIDPFRRLRQNGLIWSR